MALSVIMDLSVLLFMIKICLPGTHTEASGKDSLIPKKLTIFSDVELEAIPRECFGNSRIDLYYGRSTARVVILQCAEYTGLCQRVF